MRITDKFDRDILCYAFRYALGRRSYAVGIVIDELRRNWDDLTPFDRKLIKKEIDDRVDWWYAYPDDNGQPTMPLDIIDSWKQVLGWYD
jgi:ribosome biogenesis SPOUT family RNA methylase Rps3